VEKATAQMAPVVAFFENAGADETLRKALRSGKVQYSEGVFSGLFEAATARSIRAMGATFSSREGVYKIEKGRVPNWVLAESTAFQSHAQATSKLIMKKLDQIQTDLEAQANANPVRARRTVDSINTTWRAAAEVLEVSPELSPEMRARFAKEYSDNMKLWVKKFSEESIQDLRKVVSANAEQGYRFDNLIESIKSRYHVSTTKAKFLARQETSLFMSKFRELRYSEAGVTRYKWRTSGDGRVRDGHKKLNGKIFSYASPPIVDAQTGRRANPGQDFGCRCIDEPILDPVLQEA
jgi:SPP1 gp7 family putative phage head morphogenesis protein